MSSEKVSAREQAQVAYREMRRSLVKFAAVEAEMARRRQEDMLPPNVESLLAAERDSYNRRVTMFALVYIAETGVADRRGEK